MGRQSFTEASRTSQAADAETDVPRRLALSTTDRLQEKGRRDTLQGLDRT